MRYVKLAALVVALLALALVARPAYAGNTACAVSPDSSAPVGTTFWVTCTGFTPLVYANIYAVEPDGRASGLNIYGFFPDTVKADADGVVNFYFATEFDGLFSTSVGKYTFVVQEIGLGNTILYKQEVPITVESRAENNSSAYLTATADGYVVSFWGWGFAPYEQANVWVSQPDGAKCSGLGIDQLNLGALGAGASSLWFGPQTVKAGADGSVAFTIVFNSSACIGDYMVTVATPDKSHAAEAGFRISGKSVTEAGGASVWVSPDPVTVFGSFFAVYGSGYPANSGVNCWFTRPDGRVLSFINLNVTTDASGSFSSGATLDDFPPYTSSEPGTWYVTCATPNRSDLAIASFTAYAPAIDP